MPAELKYSTDLEIDVAIMLAEIEQTILTHDRGSGACKGRAYSCDQFHHTHLPASVSMLTRPHRDAESTRKPIAT